MMVSLETTDRIEGVEASRLHKPGVAGSSPAAAILQRFGSDLPLARLHLPWVA